MISKALGYTSLAFTMDVYSHIISGMQEEAMALLDEVLPSGVARSVAMTYRQGGSEDGEAKNSEREHERYGEGLWEEPYQESQGRGARENKDSCQSMTRHHGTSNERQSGEVHDCMPA